MPGTQSKRHMRILFITKCPQPILNPTEAGGNTKAKARIAKCLQGLSIVPAAVIDQVRAQVRINLEQSHHNSKRSWLRFDKRNEA